MAYWVDDGLDTSPEAYKAGTAAMGLYLLCGVWISRALREGRITAPVVPAETARRYGTREWAQRLVDVGLWRAEAAAGYRDLRYHEGGGPARRGAPMLNPTPAKLEADREKTRARVARHRAGRKKEKEIDSNAVTHALQSPLRPPLPTVPPIPSHPPYGGDGGGRVRPRVARGAGAAPPTADELAEHAAAVAAANAEAAETARRGANLARAALQRQEATP